MQFDRTGLESYITDEANESEGVWLKFPGDRRIKILRAGGANKRYARIFQQAIKPYKRQLDRGSLDADVSDRIMREVYAKTIVVGWMGIHDADGNTVAFSQGNVIEFFTAFPEIFTDVIDCAGEMANFQEHEVAEAAEILGEA